jgi:hypothetical protein
VNWVVHECTAACREPYYHIWYGYGTYCQTDLSVSPESARVFYLTMAWLLEEEGSYFITRYATAVNRLYTLRRVASNNNRRCAELRRAQLKASQ